MPFELSRTDAAEQLRYDYDLKGRTILQLDETIVPVVIVEPGAVEGSFVPRQGEWVTGFIGQGNVAGETAKAGFSPQAGKIAVLRGVHFSLSAGQGIVDLYKILNNGVIVAPTAAPQSAFCERAVESDNGGLFTFSANGAAIVGTPLYEFPTQGDSVRAGYGAVPPFVFSDEEVLLFENIVANGTLRLAISCQLYDKRGTRRS